MFEEILLEGKSNKIAVDNFNCFNMQGKAMLMIKYFAVHNGNEWKITS